MFCTVVSQVNSCQLLINISMVGCVLTYTPHKCDITTAFIEELELELIQTQMTQKPMLRAEVYARALRASQNRKEDSL